jgi:cellobiose-specific phosphotransferase system component IIB
MAPRLIQVALLVCLAGLSTPLWAKDVAEAEHERLAEEMKQLAERRVWSGVERNFQELLQLGVALTIDDYLQGAYAARELGDVKAVHERLSAAARLKSRKDVVDWLWDIDNNYGVVELIATSGRHATLEAAEMPFDPNQRKAVEQAIELADKENQFIGMLPKGNYNFAGQAFSVDAGLSVRIEVSPKQRRKGLVEPVIIYRDELGNPTTTRPTAPTSTTTEGAAEPMPDSASGTEGAQ